MYAQTSFESLESRQLFSVNLLADAGGFYATDAVTIKGTAYFAANDGVHGSELWRSDGTTVGTRLVSDLLAGKKGSSPTAMVNFNGALIFSATDADGSVSLWRSNGAKGGTTRLVDFPQGVSISKGVVANGRFIFAALDTNTDQIDLWTSDGTAGGTKLVQHLYDQNGSLPGLTVVGNRVLLHEANHLWSTNGTAQGTIELGDPTGVDTSRPYGVIFDFAVMNGKAVFLATDATRDGGVILWTSDGTRVGTKAIATLTGATDGAMHELNGKFVFALSNLSNGTVSLMATNGTALGTTTLVDLQGNPDQVGYLPDGRLVLAVRSNSSTAIKLWVSDGTSQGTQSFRTLTDGDLIVRGFVTVGNYSYLTIARSNADNLGPESRELWRTDGTTAGTTLVQDLTSLGEINPMHERISLADGKVVIETSDQTGVYDPLSGVPASGPKQQSIRLNSGVLRILGTRSADTIELHIDANDSSRLVVQVNAQVQSFRVSDVKTIEIYGYSGNDTINFDESLGHITASSHIWGGAGNDNIHSGSGSDIIYGEDGNDRISSGNNNDVVFGGLGNDAIKSGNGNDTASGDAGADKVIGGNGTDIIGGGDDASKDQLDGGSGVDVIFGSAVYEIFYNGARGTDPLDDVLIS